MDKQRIHSKDITTDGKEMLSVKEAGFYLGLSKVSFFNVRKKDKTFPFPYEISCYPKFKKSELDDWVKSKKMDKQFKPELHPSKKHKIRIKNDTRKSTIN